MTTMTTMTTTTTFDLVLGSLFPLALLLAGYQLRNQFLSWSELSSLLFPGSSSGPTASSIYSLERAFYAYTQYLKLSYHDVQRMRSSYRSLGRAHKNLGYKIGYPHKLERLWEVTSINATLTEAIADLAVKEHPELNHSSSIQATAADLARVRESLKHFVRDWSSEGSDERKRIFEPILNVLSQIDPSERPKKRVLVPGSGLGRLAWEISEIGFDTTANELSAFMTLAMRFLLSPQTTQQVDQHKIRPYAHWFSHQRTTENLFRSIPFPDAIPRLKDNFRLLEQDFLKIPTTQTGLASRRSTSPETSQSSGETFDYIVTLFFIDTSFNVFATMAQIYALLKPGGRWINLGPLLWPGGGQCKLELSLEEVLTAAEELGFTLNKYHRESPPNHLEAQKTVECEYTGDSQAMMRWSYKAEFWVAQKPAPS